MLIYHRKRQEKIDLQQLPTNTIPAHKAGGISSYASGSAVFEWFLLDGPDDQITVFHDGKLSETTHNGTSISEPSVETMTELESYKDVTLQILQRLLEAERLAVPEDFHGITYDMGNPVGYIPMLREIWLKSVDRSGRPSTT